MQQATPRATLLDSSAWIEYFIGNKNAAPYQEIFKNPEQILVPTVVLFEVFRIINRKRNETLAVAITDQMKRGKVIELSHHLAIWGAKLSKKHKLGAMDSLILASTYATGATLFTFDQDFEGIESVEYIAK
jgi:predicted nucleic acid-binding protein